MNLKYIVMDDMVNDMEGFIIFPEYVQHDKMAESLGGKHKAISAGFVKFATGNIGQPVATCYGYSTSLGLKSRKKDSDMITMSMN